MKNIFFKSVTTFLLFVCGFVNAQSFQGWIEYRIDTKNPMPDKISEEMWQQKMKEKLGGAEFMIQKYYYKGANYMSEVKLGEQSSFQLYNSKDHMLYNWDKGTNTAVTFNTKENDDKITDVKEFSETEEILGITCKKVTVFSDKGEMSYWYNSDHLKMDPKLYEGHKFGHFEELLKKTNSLPLKIELKQFMVHMVFISAKYEETSVNDSHFVLPKFEEVIKM